jgi:predicted GNAT family acetyltransferase
VNAVRDNADEARYELVVDGTVAGEIRYHRTEDRLALLHVEVDRALQGRGLGSELMAGALDDLRARGLQAVPVCPFAEAYVRRHPEYADIVVAG